MFGCSLKRTNKKRNKTKQKKQGQSVCSYLYLPLLLHNSNLYPYNFILLKEKWNNYHPGFSLERNCNGSYKMSIDIIQHTHTHKKWQLKQFIFVHLVHLWLIIRKKMSNKQEKVYFSFNTREQTRIGMDDEWVTHHWQYIMMIKHN